MTQTLDTPVQAAVLHDTRIADITPQEWIDAKYLDSGSHGHIYRIRPGLVAKLSEWLDDEEPEMQMRFFTLGKALPVFDFLQECYTVPRDRARVARVCLVHDMDYDANRFDCICAEPISVMLMPEALPPPPYIRISDIRDFAYEFSDFALEEAEFDWDSHMGNVGYYEGHLVALDFG